MTPHEPIRFTIVIPTYNREQFILATLETVFKQKYQNYEIIVVDNCSTDNTEAVFKTAGSGRKDQLHKARPQL